jgi:peptidyl-prolyl isomerase D
VPAEPVVITKSGVMDATDPFFTQSAAPADGDKYEAFPEDDDNADVQKPEVALSIAQEIREIGNKLFKEGNVREALNKYQST